MSAGNDQGSSSDGGSRGGPDDRNTGRDLSDEIDRTMAEAEAAVSSMGDDPDSTGEATSAEGADEAGSEGRIALLEQEVATLKDKWLRAVADLDNYKKRVKREIEEAQMRTAQKLLPAFLPVMDNLERALEVAEPAAKNASDENAQAVEQVVTGIRMVRTEFLNALARNGIEPVETVGRPFDPANHDALQQFDSPDHAPGIIIREFEKGYRLGERLLRPARVIVAGPGSTGRSPEQEQES